MSQRGIDKSITPTSGQAARGASLITTSTAGLAFEARPDTCRHRGVRAVGRDRHAPPQVTRNMKGPTESGQ
ncbi:hypothetical protein hbim_06219 [Mycolicibacterium mageritense]|uniref:Uncharacterized protein n=1 Tax=Mycolicibacterium mageritense TaxID=53462 RepID=A0AAI8U1H5_MYCME|nr:hypothetical protein hbim_06219 [Mycolicibacterium mageritense]